MPAYIVKVLNPHTDEYYETAPNEIKAAFLAGMEAQDSGEYDADGDEDLVVTVELNPQQPMPPQPGFGPRAPGSW